MQRVAIALIPCCLVAAVAHATAEHDPELAEVVVTAPEPRYVAPTTLDRIGRVWVPVQMNGQGEFRMVLDTGAQRSAVSAATAARLGLPLDQSPKVIVHGTTGSAVTPTIAVDSLQLGDMQLRPSSLPVVADVFGGADGLLGTEGMQEHRIYIDFRHDQIDIARSRNRSAPSGFSTVRFLQGADQLPVVRARVGNLDVRAVIDTGAQATVGNPALQQAMRKRRRHGMNEGADRVHGATGVWQAGTGANLSPIRLGSLEVVNARITFADLHIFNHWGLDEEPAMVIGMDILGLVDELVIDYRRSELQIKPRAGR